MKEKISRLPQKPGIYQYKNESGKIIYIGKAIKLRNRVRSYFNKGKPVDAKTKALVGHIADVDVIVTDSEAEALILESGLNLPINSKTGKFSVAKSVVKKWAEEEIKKATTPTLLKKSSPKL